MKFGQSVKGLEGQKSKATEESNQYVLRFLHVHVGLWDTVPVSEL